MNAPSFRQRLSLAFNPRAVSWAEGVRAALAVAVIVAANLWLEWPPLIEAALGALLTCLCDAGGPIRKRVPAVLAFSVIGAAITAAMGLARAQGVYVAVPLACATLFCTSYARVYGPAAMQVGNLLGVVTVLGLDRATDLAEAGVLSACFLGGGLWAALLTMAIWRVYPNLPARRAVAGVYLALAAMSADMRRTLGGGDSPEVWEAHARAHRRKVREAIEAARVSVLETIRTRGASSGRAGQSMLRLEAADQVFGFMIALSDLAEEGFAPAALDRILDLLRPVLAALAHSIVADRPDDGPAIERALAALSDAAAELPDGDRLHRAADAIVERLRIAATLSTSAGYTPDMTNDGGRPPWRQRLLAPLRANWSFSSLVFRHALRLVTVAAPAVTATMIWFDPYEHWLTITLLVTMQPYFAMTFTRAVERVGGTLAGGLIAAVVGIVCQTPVEIAVAMFPLLMIALSLRQVSFGLFITALTPMIVLLSELGRPGTSEWVIAGLRAAFTLAGGLLAVAGCYLLWPSWEPVRLREEVRRAIAAHAAYAEAALAAVMDPNRPSDSDRLRRAAGLATNNVEASLSRALLEPGQLSGERVEAAMVIDAALRRMAGRLAAMQLDPELAGALPAPAWTAWRDWIVASARALEAGAPPPGARPALAKGAGAAGEALSRIARQIELMSGALARLA